MGKRDKIHTLARLIALAVAHRIGVLLDLHSTYANKYRKECANFIRQAENTQWGEHWSSSDKKEILEIPPQAHQCIQNDASVLTKVLFLIC